MTDRTWNYHGMNHKALRTRTSVPLDHISDKNGRRGDIPPNEVAVPKTTFSHAFVVMAIWVFLPRGGQLGVARTCMECSNSH